MDRLKYVISPPFDKKMLMYRFLLVVGISLVTLLISITLDFALASLPVTLQFLIQIPILVLILEEGRRWMVRTLDTTLTVDEINSCFFFAAPLAAFGSMRLFQGLERILHS